MSPFHAGFWCSDGKKRTPHLAFVLPVSIFQNRQPQALRQVEKLIVRKKQSENQPDVK